MKFLATILAGLAASESCSNLTCSESQECICRIGNDEITGDIVLYTDDCACFVNEETQACASKPADFCAANAPLTRCESSYDPTETPTQFRATCSCEIGAAFQVSFDSTTFQFIESCVDDDECLVGSHNCHEDAICTNKSLEEDGELFSCECMGDLLGDGTDCYTTTTLTTTTTTTTTTTSEIDCPTYCWEVNENKICVPKASSTSVSCSSVGMEIMIDTCLFEDTMTFEAHLLDETCAKSGIMEDGSFHLMTSLEECGTTLTSSDNDMVVFSQTVFAKGDSGVFYIGEPFALDFKCNYNSKSETKVVQEFSKVTTATGSEGTGDFAFEIKMYQDFDFVEPVSAKDVIMVGESVFFAVEGVSFPSSLSFVVETCNISNAALGMSYPIISDGCADLITRTQFLNDAPFSSAAHVGYSSFRFDQNIDNQEDHEEELTCQISVCDNNDNDSICQNMPNC